MFLSSIKVLSALVLITLTSAFLAGCDGVTINVDTTETDNGKTVIEIQEDIEKESEKPSEPVPVTQRTYLHELFTLDYPSDYTVSVDQYGTVSFVGEAGSIQVSEIDLSFGAPGPAAPSNPEEQLPKDMVFHGYDAVINSALFYKKGDEVTKKELKEIQDSIKLTGKTTVANEVGSGLTKPDVQPLAPLDTIVFPIVAEEQFGLVIRKNLENKIPLVKTKKRELALPNGIHDGQLSEFYEWGDLVFALVRQKSMNVPMTHLPSDAETTFAGLLMADFEAGEWVEYMQINDLADTAKNNPYALWREGKKLILTIVDQNGAGSGEGIMKVLEMNDGESWMLTGCHYFMPDADSLGAVYFEDSKDFANQTMHSGDSCYNLHLKSFNGLYI